MGLIGWKNLCSFKTTLLNPPPFIINEVFLGRVPPSEGGWPVLLIQLHSTVLNGTEAVVVYLGGGLVGLVSFNVMLLLHPNSFIRVQQKHHVIPQGKKLIVTI